LRANTAHLYDWVSYFAETKPAPVTVEGNWVKAPASSTDVLGINVLAPAGFTYDLGAGVHPYTNGTQTKPYIHLHPAANVANTRFVTVLYLTTNADWANKPAMALLDNTDQGVGVRVTSNGTQDHLFNYSGAAQAGIGEYALTGEVASVSKDASGNPSQIFIGNGTQLSDGNGARILFQAPAAVTAEAVISGTSLALNGASLNGLRIYAPQTDAAQVTVNGIAVAAVKSGDTIILPGGPVPVSVLPPGRGVWWIVGIVMGLAAWLPLVRGMRKNRSRLL
ncbi:MAG: hypothetical protein ABSE59_08325, partial [Opitutaceae bacterium]